MFPWRGSQLLVWNNKQSKIEIRRDGRGAVAAGVCVLRVWRPRVSVYLKAWGGEGAEGGEGGGEQGEGGGSAEETKH